MSSVDDALKAIQISPISYTESKKRKEGATTRGNRRGSSRRRGSRSSGGAKAGHGEAKLETVLRDLNCIFEDDIAMLVLETVDKAVSDPKLVKKVNIRMKRKSKNNSNGNS